MPTGGQVVVVEVAGSSDGGSLAVEMPASLSCAGLQQAQGHVAAAG